MSDPADAAALAVVDAHHHFWDPRQNYHPWLCDRPPIRFRYGDYSALRRRFMPDEYFAAAAGQNVVATISMEGEWDPRDPVGESRWMQGVAERYGCPQAHVAQAWLDAPDVEAVLTAQAALPLVKSVRHKPTAAPAPDKIEPGAPGSMGCPRWRAGYALLADLGLRFDLQTPWWHLSEALALAECYPDTPIVLNHAGLPADRSAAGLAGWRAALRQFAAFPNGWVKISGLGLPGRPWQLEDNVGIIHTTLELFGTGRCMFASNFPVDGLCGSFDTIYGGYKQATSGLPPAERRRLFSDNALACYDLSL